MTEVHQDEIGPGSPALTPAPVAPPRFWTRPPVIIIGGVLLLAIGAGIGQSANITTQKNLTAARGQLTAVRGQLAATRAQLGTEKSRLSAEQTAVTQADATAAQKYKTDEAKLAQNEAAVATTQRALDLLEGKIQATAISADGVYVVGSDIKSGIWHTSGDGGQGGNQCYYATLNSTNTEDISDNNNFDGPETVDVSGAFAFEISGPCTWYRTGA